LEKILERQLIIWKTGSCKITCSGESSCRTQKPPRSHEAYGPRDAAVEL